MATEDHSDRISAMTADENLRDRYLHAVLGREMFRNHAAEAATDADEAEKAGESDEAAELRADVARYAAHTNELSRQIRQMRGQATEQPR